jgi:cobalt/nickel transport system permease protein
MLFAHLLVAGVAEGIVTAAVIAYLQRTNLPLMQVNHPGVPVDADAAAAQGSRRRWLRPTVVAGAVMALMVVLTPLGLLAQGTAFGEHAPEELDLQKLDLSAIPEGLNRYSRFWQKAIFPDYDFVGAATPVVRYLVSAVIGILVVRLAVWIIAKLVALAANRGKATGEPRTSEEVRS